MTFSNVASASVATAHRSLPAAHLGPVDAVVFKHFDAVTAVITYPGDSARRLRRDPRQHRSGLWKAPNCLADRRFLRLDDGAVDLDNARIDHLPAHKRGTAMVFQDYALFPHMRVMRMLPMVYLRPDCRKARSYSAWRKRCNLSTSQT